MGIMGSSSLKCNLTLIIEFDVINDHRSPSNVHILFPMAGISFSDMTNLISWISFFGLIFCPKGLPTLTGSILAIWPLILGNSKFLCQAGIITILIILALFITLLARLLLFFFVIGSQGLYRV